MPCAGENLEWSFSGKQIRPSLHWW